MALPANITGGDNNVLSIAASNNKGLLIRFLNEQVEDGFYALVIDYLKDSNFDLKNMTVDDDVKAGHLIPLLESLLNDKAKQESLRRGSKSMAMPDTSAIIAESINEVVQWTMKN